MRQSILKPLALLALTLTLLYSSALAGGDVYRIYLNNKLILQQFVTQPLRLSSLQLDKANSNDRLVIYYSHCGATGKGRSISVKDEQGSVLKEWKFSDASGENAGMSIPVKEILGLQRQHSLLSIYYSSTELPAGRMLTLVSNGGKNTGYHRSLPAVHQRSGSPILQKPSIDLVTR